MQVEKLDAVDLQILEVLQTQGRTKRNELADTVKLSIPAVSERLRKLEDRGIIRSFNAMLEARKVGLEVTAFIFVMAESSTFYPEIIKRATAHEEILECHAITGEGSHILKARTRSTSTLEKLLSQIQSWPGVKNTRTSIVLSSPKETTVLPLTHLKTAS
ncbi:Lrp/AsnC family transcriptional regulator [candidate division KSB1 bacterium]|nr:Lrp/AsnC family transcriptional regulator [candidate division KSB1 bacterium]